MRTTGRSQFNSLLIGLMLVALLGVAMLWRQVSKLNQENEALRKERAAVEQLLAEREEQDRARAKEAEESKLTVGQQLTSQGEELESLRQQAQERTALASENQRLREQVQVLQQPLAVQERALANRPRQQDAKPVRFSRRPWVDGNVDPDLTEQDKLEAYLCVNHLRQISLATERWANQHDGYAPKNLMQLREDLAPMILVCPSSEPSSLAREWSFPGHDFDPATISYKLISPGIKWGASSQTYVFCPIHRNPLLNGGTTGILTKYTQ